MALAAAQYCSDVAGYNTLPTPTANADGMRITDVTYGVNGPSVTTSFATDCFGQFTGGSGGNAEASDVNALTKWVQSSGLPPVPDLFVELVKADTGTTGSGTALNFKWTLNGSTAATTGSWTLTSDPLVNPPSFFDFVVALKGNNGTGLYFFDQALFDGSSGGSWTITFENNGGQNPNLSNMVIFGRIGSPSEPPEVIPLPGTLALFGLALVGLGTVKRRYRSV
jgi:hypothetical protein